MMRSRSVLDETTNSNSLPTIQKRETALVVCIDAEDLDVPDSAKPDIPPEFIAGIFADADEKERQAEAARKRADSWVAVLLQEGLGHLIPDTALAKSQAGSTKALTAVAHAVPEAGTWTGEILRIVEGSPDGATRATIKDQLARSGMAGKMRTNPAGFYNGVDRLMSREQIIARGGRLFTPTNLESFISRVAKGEIEDFADGEALTSSKKALDFVSANPGLSAGEIAKALVNAGRFPSVGSVHNQLSKLFTTNNLQRIGGKYYPLKENGSPAGDPDTGGDAA